MALSDGMVAVVRSADTPGGLCVTLTEGNRQYTLMPNSDVPQHMLSNHSPYPRKTQSTNTQKPPTAYNEVERYRNVYDSSTQAVDGQYASIYKMAHCNLHPTSPPVQLSEFPPQRPGVCRGEGNFMIGGCGSMNNSQSPPRNSTNLRMRSNWPTPGPATHLYPRPAHRPDAFSKSLRNYPSMSPERSAEVVERLINYSNTRNNTITPERLVMSKNHSQCSKCSAPMTECFQQLDSRNGRPTRPEIFDESPTRDRWQRGEEKQSLRSRCDIRSMSDDKYKDFQRACTPANLYPSIMERLNHIPSKFNNNMPGVNRHYFANMETQAAVPTVSREMATVPRPPVDVRNVAIFVSPTSSSFKSESQHCRLKVIRHSKSISIQTQISDVLTLRKKSATTCFSSVNLRNNKKVGQKRRSKSQVDLKIDDYLDEQLVQIIQDLTKPSAHLRSKVKKARKQKHDKHEPKVKIDKCETDSLLLSEINLREFTRELSNELLSKIKRQNIILQPTDLNRANYLDWLKTNYEQCFTDEIVIEWLSDIPIKRTDYLGRPVVKENILETVRDKVYNILINKLKYSEASTKADIIDILEDMPIDVTGYTRRSFLSKLVTELTSKVKMSTSYKQWKKLPDFCNYVQPTEEEVKQFIENEVTDLQRKFSLLICHDTVGHMVNELTVILLDSMEAIKRGKIRDVIDEVLTITSEFLSISEFQSIYFAHNLVYNLFQQSNSNEPFSYDFLCYSSSIQETNHNNTDSSVENETEQENTDNRSDFAGKIAVQVNEWLSTIKDIEIINSSSRSDVVNNLTSDIVDRQKYLKICPSIPNSEEVEELEHLKYQIFKWVNKVLGADNTDTFAKANDLFMRIKSIPATQTDSQEEEIVMPKPTDHSSNEPFEQRRDSRPFGQPNQSSNRPSSTTVPSANVPNESRRDSRPFGLPNQSSNIPLSATDSSANVPNESRRDSRPVGQPNQSSNRPPSVTFPLANVPNESRRDSRPVGQPNQSSNRPSSVTFPSANVPNESRRDSRFVGQPNQSNNRPSSATDLSANVPNESRRDSRPVGQPNQSSNRPSSATDPSANVLNESRRDSRLVGQPNQSNNRPSSATDPSANVPNESRSDSRPVGQPNQSSNRPSSATDPSANVLNESRRDSRPDGQPNQSNNRPSFATDPSANVLNESRRDSRPVGQPNQSNNRPSFATDPSANVLNESRRDSRPVGQPNQSNNRASFATDPLANVLNESRRDSRPVGQPNQSNNRPSSATDPSANVLNESRRDSRPVGQPNQSNNRPSFATDSSANVLNESRRDSRPDGQPNQSNNRPSFATDPSANVLNESRRDSRPVGQPNQSNNRPSFATDPSANVLNESRRDSRPVGQPNQSNNRPSFATDPSADALNESRRESRPVGQPNQSNNRPSSATVPSANVPNEQRRNSRPDGQPNQSSIRPVVLRSATIPSAAQNKSIKQLSEEYDAYVKDWVQRVPITFANPKDEAIAEKARLGLYIGVWKAITKLKMSPEILDNPYHYQDALDDELEILLQCLPQTQEFKTKKHVLKPELIEKTMIFNESVANVAVGTSSYRQQLVDNVDNSLPKQTEINTAGKNIDRLYEEWEKNLLAEYYILYNTFKIDDRVKAIAYKKKLMRHVEMMIDNIKATTKQELKEVDYRTYKDEILAALDEVPIPSDETLKEEAGEIQILLEVEQWFRDLPLLPSKKQTATMEVKVFQDLLARKLYDIDAHCNPITRTNLMTQEIRRFLERLPLREEEKPNMNFMVEELLNRLDNINNDVVVVSGENKNKPINFLEGYDYDAFSSNRPVSSTFEGNPPRDPYDGSSYFISEGARVPDEQGWQMIRDPTGISEQYLTIEGLTGPRMPSAPHTPQNGGVPPSNQFQTEQTINDSRPVSGNGTRNGQASSRSNRIMEDPAQNGGVPQSNQFQTEQTTNDSRPVSGNGTRNGQASSRSNRILEDPVSHLSDQNQSGYGTRAEGYDPNRLQPPPVDINKTAMPQQYRTSPMPDCCYFPTPQDHGTFVTPTLQDNERYATPREQMNGAYGMSGPRGSSTPQDLRTSGTYSMQEPQQLRTSAMRTSQDYRPSAMPRPEDNGAYSMSRPPDCSEMSRNGASVIPRPQEQRPSVSFRPIDNESFGMSRTQDASTPQDIRTTEQGTNPLPRTLDSGTTPVYSKSERRSSAPPLYRPSRSQYPNNLPPTPDPYTPYSTPHNEAPQTPRKCRKEIRDSARRQLFLDETENESDTDYGCRCMEKIWRCRRRKPVCEMRGYIPCEDMPYFMRMREPCYYRS